MIIGVDIGGTFTDFIISKGDIILSLKLPTSLQDPAQCVVDGLKELKIKSADLIHGSTIATNAFLERKGARVSLIITKGFKDLLKIARQTRSKLYELSWSRPEPLITEDTIFEIKERIDHQGKILIPLDTKELQRLSKKLKDAQSIAICFLHSYRNPSHEIKAKRSLRKNTSYICRSSEIANEYREYERFSTTLINAYVSPVMNNYLSKLNRCLDNFNIRLMASNGGTISLKASSKRAVDTIMSGPAAGVIATKELMKIIKINRAISFDMGGTSTDVSLIEKEERITKEAKIDGFAIKLPMIEIKTVGSGGGSIAWLDRLGILHVGPESQGANPGPACYMKGGRLATVTDANLILGRLNADMFLAGKIKLDIKGAYNAIAKLGRLLHKSPLKIAEAIIKVANSNMARAIRVISVEKGYDPREFSLIAFGGAGPMHACELAMMLGIKHIIIPRYPGTFSALGMLMADITKELSKTLLIPFEDRYFYRIISSFERLTKTSLTDLKKEGININNFISKKMLDLRYKGQSYEIITPWQGSINKTKKEFNRLHEKLYGFSRDDAQIELVNVCVRIKIPSSRLTFTPLSSTRSKPKIFCAKNCVIKTKNLKIRHYLRDSFPRYYEIKGPALILEDHSTTFIPPEFDLYVDGFGNLILSHK